jgi:hypothetical protein
MLEVKQRNNLDALAWCGLPEHAIIARITHKLVMRMRRQRGSFFDSPTVAEINDAVDATYPPRGTKGKRVEAVRRLFHVVQRKLRKREKAREKAKPDPLASDRTLQQRMRRLAEREFELDPDDYHNDQWLFFGKAASGAWVGLQRDGYGDVYYYVSDGETVTTYSFAEDIGEPSFALVCEQLLHAMPYPQFPLNGGKAEIDWDNRQTKLTYPSGRVEIVRWKIDDGETE